MTVEPLIPAPAAVTFVLPVYPPGTHPRSAHPQIDLAHMAVELSVLRAEIEVLTIELVACAGDRGMARDAITLAHAETSRLRRAVVACLDSGSLTTGAAYQARTALASVPVDVRDTPPLASV